MTHTPRHQEILKILNSLRSVTVNELTERLNVSEVTIRKDLAVLEDMNALIRTRGGATLAEDSRLLHSLDLRRNENIDQKERIGLKAKEFVREGDTIFIDSGSTCHVFSQQLVGMNLRVVTNSIDVMNALANAPGIALFSLGGSYRKDAGSFLGPIPLELVKNFQIESCFIGATGISEEGLFSSQNTIESQLKSAVIGVSGRKIILADSKKYGNKAFSVFAREEDIDIWITGKEFKDSEKMKDKNFEIILA